MSLSIHVCIYYTIRIEQKLQLTESNHNVESRWLTTSQEYKDTIATGKSKEKQKLRIKMQKEARERWFLLRLKSKYAGMFYVRMLMLYVNISYKLMYSNIQ